MAVKLQIFRITKFLRWTLIISFDSALKKVDNYYHQVFLKGCKYIEKNVIRHINDYLSDFSSSDEFDEE